MRILLFIAALFISFSGLTQSKQEDIVGLWRFMGPVCGSDGTFKNIATSKEKVGKIVWEIKSDGTIIFYAPHCELKTSYTYNGSKFSFSVKNADTSHCPGHEFFRESEWPNVIVYDDFLLLQYPERLLQLLAIEDNVANTYDGLPEECTVNSMYDVFFRIPKKILKRK